MMIFSKTGAKLVSLEHQAANGVPAHALLTVPDGRTFVIWRRSSGHQLLYGLASSGALDSLDPQYLSMVHGNIDVLALQPESE
jgi:hypothetical protein